jgi:hypothetical protein
LRPVYSAELQLGFLRLDIQVHALRLGPAIYYVAVLLAPILVGRGRLALALSADG